MRLEVNLPDEIIKQFDDMANLDKLAPAMLKRAAPYLVDAVRKGAEAHVRTGSMARSVKARKPKKTKYDSYEMKVGFSGYDMDRHPNVVKAAGIEYGNAHEAPHPFIQAAADSCAEDVSDAMQRAYNEEVEK